VNSENLLFTSMSSTRYIRRDLPSIALFGPNEDRRKAIASALARDAGAAIP